MTMQHDIALTLIPFMQEERREKYTNIHIAVNVPFSPFFITCYCSRYAKSYVMPLLTLKNEQREKKNVMVKATERVVLSHSIISAIDKTSMAGEKSHANINISFNRKRALR